MDRSWGAPALALWMLIAGVGCGPADECRSADDCPDDQACVANRCRTSCSKHSDCPADSLCTAGFCFVGERPVVDAGQGDARPGDAVVDGTPALDAGSDALAVDAADREAGGADVAVRDQYSTDHARSDATADRSVADHASLDLRTPDTDGADGGLDAGPPPTGWRALSVGSNHGCGVKHDGSLWCWGQNLNGELGLGNLTPQQSPARVGSASDWLAVAVDSYNGLGHFSCGIRAPGSLWCWGDNRKGQLGLGHTEGKSTPQRVGLGAEWQMVSAGALFACGLHAGTLHCWGGNNWGQLGSDTAGAAVTAPRLVELTSEPDKVDWVQVSAGSGYLFGIDTPHSVHACAIDADGTLFCWGHNLGGQLGDGTSGNSATPVLVGEGWRTVRAGLSASCGIKLDGTLHCWGTLGSYLQSSTPVRLGVDTGWLEVGLGDSFLCGRRSTSVYCLGDNSYGQLGRTDGSGESLSAVVLGHGVAQLQVGMRGSCAMTTDDRRICWGDNRTGALGLGGGAAVAEPWVVSADHSLAQVSAGASYACGVRSDGTAWCWGRNDMGQSGLAASTPVVTPNPIGSNTDWRMVSAGATHSCGIREPGTLWCWGDNIAGRLGNDSTVDSFTPVQEATAAVDWARLEVTHGHSCALKTDATLWCWGSNGGGELGVGDRSPRWVPTEVSNGGSWIRFGLGRQHSCAVRTDGTLWCWGINSNHQLGTDTTNEIIEPQGTPIQTVPKQIGADVDWVAVAGGEVHSCGLRGGTADQHALYCWGGNSDGQLGIGNNDEEIFPTDTAITGSVVAAGGFHTCLLGDEVSCWGSNVKLQLGRGSWSAQEPLPGTVAGFIAPTALTLGTYCSCASDDGGTVWCWGSNEYGQYGDGLAWTFVPLDVD